MIYLMAIRTYPPTSASKCPWKECIPIFLQHHLKLRWHQHDNCWAAIVCHHDAATSTRIDCCRNLYLAKVEWWYGSKLTAWRADIASNLCACTTTIVCQGAFKKFNIMRAEKMVNKFKCDGPSGARCWYEEYPAPSYLWDLLMSNGYFAHWPLSFSLNTLTKHMQSPEILPPKAGEVGN